MKKLASLLIILQLGISSFSQCYFQNHYSVDQFDYFNCVNINNDNNIIVVGSWGQSIYCTPDYEDRPHAFYILEIDSCGLLINETIIVNDTDNLISYIEQTDTNSYFLLGSIRMVCHNSFSFSYMNISRSGEVINSGIFGENYTGQCVDATKLSNNNYVMIGNDLVLKVNAMGDTIASVRINYPDEYGGLMLQKITNIPGTNSVILIGQLRYPFDFMIIRLDDELNTVWENIYDRTTFDFIYSLNITQDNNIIIAGNVVDTIIDNLAYPKSFIQRMNLNGDSLWCNYYGGMGSPIIYSVKEIPETKDIIATGSYADSGGGNGYFMRVDSIGNLINDTIFGGEDRDIFRNQWIIDSLNIFLFGSTYNYYPTFSFLYIVKTNSNGYQGPYTNITDISESNDVLPYPNPFQNKVTFSGTRESLIQSIYIYNIYGNVVYIKNGINSSNHTVLTNNFRRGIYFCNLIFSNGQTTNRKIIKQ